MSETLVVCVRDPDYGNEFRVFGPHVEIHDIDLGYANLADVEEYLPWAVSHLTSAAALLPRFPEAAGFIRSMVEQKCPWDDTFPPWPTIWARAEAEGHT